MADAVTPFFAAARNGRSFAAAAKSYLEHGGSPRYLQRVVDYFGETSIDQLVPFEIHRMAEVLYPSQSGRHEIARPSPLPELS